jgi:hypothetical protein
MLHRLAALFSAMLLTGAALSAQTVTEENLLGLKRSNAPDELIIKAIAMAKKIEIDTSFENTVLLMSKGVSQAVVNALVQRKEELVPQATSPVASTAPANGNPLQTVGVCPQREGAYFLSPSGWKKMEQAPLQEMSQNLTRATNPFGKKTTGSKLDGPEAPVKVGLQPEFCVVDSSETVARSLMILKLAKRGKNRELTTSSSGVFRRTKIMEYDKLENLQIERKSEREIIVKLPGEIQPGEYALMIRSGLVFDFSARAAESDAAQK